MRLALHCDEDGERFLLESKMLLCAHTDEIDAGHTSACILDENHNTQSEHASICLSCYDRLRENWPVRKRRCSLTCVKPLRSFTGRYGRTPRLPTRVGHTTVPRKLCSMNCASVLASCGSQVRCNSKRIGWQLEDLAPDQRGEISMIISSSRIAPEVRSTDEEWLAAYDLEKGFSDLQSRRGTATRITRLTRREHPVVNLFLEGCENIDIARQLGIAHRTVKACFNRL